MYLKRQKGLVLASLLMLFALTACSEQPTQTAAPETAAPPQKTASAETANDPQGQKTYLVAVSATYAPYAFRDENGWVIGFDADVLNAIAKKQGFNLKLINRPWEGIFNTLGANGDRDIVAGGVTITEERKTKMEFTDPYLKNIRAAAVMDSKIKTFDELADKRIAAQKDSTEQSTLEQYFTKPNLVLTDTVYLTIKNILSNDADAAFADVGVLSYYINHNFSGNQLHMIALPSTVQDTELLGFSVKKGDAELLNKLNVGLKQIKEDGTYDALYAKWFGNSAIDLKTK